MAGRRLHDYKRVFIPLFKVDEWLGRLPHFLRLHHHWRRTLCRGPWGLSLAADALKRPKVHWSSDYLPRFGLRYEEVTDGRVAPLL